MSFIQKLWNEKPIYLIMILAIISRIVAIFFAKGYGMSDDHFLVLEWAQNWLDGEKINRLRPAGHSIVYPGLHYFVLLAFQKIGFYKPDFMMYIVRFLHASLSLLTIYFGYKIIELRTNQKTAAEAGLLLAILWLFPFMSVRNLIEFVCIPFIMIAAYYLLRYEDQKKLSFVLFAGLSTGLAFVFRYQVNLFVVGFFIILLIRKDIKAAITLTIGFVLSSFLIQGIADWVAYGYPYASFLSYYLYNSSNAYNYTTGAWYIYIFTLMGVLIPPASFLILFGFLRQWKRWAIVVWPVLFFLVFHSIFPNKQERFILPAVPLLIIIGIAGWREFSSQSSFWQKHHRLHNILWKWFWVVNCVLLIFVTTTYSKRARVETMNYLSTKNDVTAILVETSDRTAPQLPLFYLGKRVPIYIMNAKSNIDSIRSEISKGTTPNYIVMMNHKRIEERSQRLNQLYPKRIKLTEISPSLIDQLLYILNPRHNVNQRCSIYKVENIN